MEDTIDLPIPTYTILYLSRKLDTQNNTLHWHFHRFFVFCIICLVSTVAAFSKIIHCLNTWLTSTLLFYSSGVPVQGYISPIERSNYFRHCQQQSCNFRLRAYFFKSFECQHPIFIFLECVMNSHTPHQDRFLFFFLFGCGYCVTEVKCVKRIGNEKDAKWKLNDGRFKKMAALLHTFPSFFNCGGFQNNCGLVSDSQSGFSVPLCMWECWNIHCLLSPDISDDDKHRLFVSFCTAVLGLLPRATTPKIAIICLIFKNYRLEDKDNNARWLEPVPRTHRWPTRASSLQR
jgi:hypothetical protein